MLLPDHWWGASTDSASANVRALPPRVHRLLASACPSRISTWDTHFSRWCRRTSCRRRRTGAPWHAAAACTILGLRVTTTRWDKHRLGPVPAPRPCLEPPSLSHWSTLTAKTPKAVKKSKKQTGKEFGGDAVKGPLCRAMHHSGSSLPTLVVTPRLRQPSRICGGRSPRRKYCRPCEDQHTTLLL
jgi:hypothetical protein